MDTEPPTLPLSNGGVIEVPPNAGDTLRFLAQTLQTRLETLTGAAWLLSNDRTHTGLRLVIGAKPTEDGPELPFDRLEYDGYFLWSIDDTVYLAGCGEHGTANAVAGFMQDVLGVRHYAPGPLGVHFASPKITSIPAVQLVSNPSFPTRAFGLANPAAREWCYANRLFNKPDPRPFVAASHHNIGNIFLREDIVRDHPEYFALRGGTRMVPGLPRGGKYDYLALAFAAQPCFSNPGVVAETVRAARAYFDANPSAHTYSLGVNDTELFCECAECARWNAGPLAAVPLVSNRRLNQKADGHAAPNQSNVYFRFVNEVARQVRHSHPSTFVGCLAYEAVEEPPTAIARMEDNVCICLTQDSSQYFDAAYRERDVAILEAWLAKCRHVMKYDYYGLMWYLPRVYTTTVADDLKRCARRGLVGMYSEVHPIWPFTGPMLYLAAQLLWDASLDPNALLERYYRDLYGPAADSMAAFYAHYERRWQRERPGRWFQGLLFPPQLDQFDRADAEAAQAHLDSARALAPPGVIRDRVDWVRRYHAVPLQILRAWAAAQRARQADNSEAMHAAIEEAVSALDALDRAHKAVLEDPTAERSVWTGFRYAAVHHYMHHQVRDTLYAAVRNHKSRSAPLCTAFPALHSLFRFASDAAGGVEYETIPLAFPATLRALGAVDPASEWAFVFSAPPGQNSTLSAVQADDGGIRVTGPGTGTLARLLAVEPGRAYMAEANVATGGVSILSGLTLALQWLDAQQQPVANGPADVCAFPSTQGEAVLRVAGTAPAKAAGCRIELVVETVMRTEWFDIAPVRVSARYFDT